MELIRLFRKAREKIKTRWYMYRFVTRDIAIQKRSLEGYVSGIQKVDVGSPLESSIYAIFVYFEQQEVVSASVQRLLVCLRAHGVNTIVVCNHELEPAQHQFFTANTHTVTTRNNQGFDFGAYKDAVRYLLGLAVPVERLLLMNDSVFFGSRGLDEFITEFLGPEDAIAAHENWGDDHHFQSFALSISARVAGSDEFREFWESYIPVSNRRYAIESGEKKLTRALLARAQSSRVIFSAARLKKVLDEQKSGCLDRISVVAIPWRPALRAIENTHDRWRTVATTLTEGINETSTIHAGAYFFPKYLNSPLFKKDLVYRSRFRFWEIESWIGELMPPEEAAEFLMILRKKGDHTVLGGLDRKRYNVGAK